MLVASCGAWFYCARFYCAAVVQSFNIVVPGYLRGILRLCIADKKILRSHTGSHIVMTRSWCSFSTLGVWCCIAESPRRDGQALISPRATELPDPQLALTLHPILFPNSTDSHKSHASLRTRKRISRCRRYHGADTLPSRGRTVALRQYDFTSLKTFHGSEEEAATTTSRWKGLRDTSHEQCRRIERSTQTFGSMRPFNQSNLPDRHMPNAHVPSHSDPSLRPHYPSPHPTWISRQARSRHWLAEHKCLRGPYMEQLGMPFGRWVNRVVP